CSSDLITRPPRVSAVSARGAGLLKSISVDEGDYVEAGATIARLDATHVDLQQRHARAQLKAAEVQLEAATREQDRMTKLAGMKATPQANVDRAETSAEAAAAQVELAKVGLAMARQAERDAEVKAPFAGVVLQRMKAPGEWVATTPPAPLVQLAQVQPMELRVDVPGPFLARIAAGQTLQVTLTALGRAETATITRVLPEVKAATRTFTVVAELPNAARDIPVGTFAEVELRPAPAPAAEAGR
ncbi:MAG: efflux RND transporter periplasmic adaptor subunit, partial [Myxococcales bacterium]|nr:efflux RND transporter periplasmic adaptor subunit [Myxococcales bacterium]